MKFDPDDFVAGVPALDFLNTVDSWNIEQPTDRLVDLESWLAWAVGAGLLTPAEQRRALANPPPAASNGRFLAEVRRFRADWQALLHTLLATGRAPAEPTSAVERAGKRAWAARSLIAQDGGIEWSWDPEVPAWELALDKVVTSALELVVDAERLKRVHECPAEDCGWFFLDTSKNGSRRWCSMKTCGNVAKVRRFHARQRGT